MPNYRASVVQISRDSLHRLRSYCWETARRSIKPNFSVHPVGKTMRSIKKWMNPFDGLDELYHRAKFGEDRTTRAACRWCLSLFFLSRSESRAPCVRGVHSSNKHCVAVYRSISTRFTAFFSQETALSDTLHNSHIFSSLGGATIFAKLRSQIAKSPRIGRKDCAHHFV